ncbi:MAG: winged helix-turn-helix domain-containing protein, partial [Actinomycetota bacterium]
MSLNLKSNNYQNNLKEIKDNDSLVYEFEGFRLDAAFLMLSRHGEEFSLTPKVVETLLALVERQGEIVSKDELMERLWENSFVEESNLIQNIYVLRKAVGTMPNGRPIIETLRRRGYRFNAEVTISSEEKRILVGGKAAIQTEESSPVRLPAAASPKAKRYRFLVRGLLATCCLMILAGFIWLVFFNFQQQNRALSTQPPNIVFKRLTPDIDAHFPVVSPDGKYLAYSQIEHGKDSLWLKDIASDGAVQLLPPIDLGEGYTVLHFSPDGTGLYYSTHRPNTPNGTIFRLTLANGAQQIIAGDDISPSAVSPDGKQLVFINSKYDLMMINTDGSGERVLRHSDPDEHFVSWGSQMSWSADGARIVLCGGHNLNGSYYADLIEISVSDGSERRVFTSSILQ